MILLNILVLHVYSIDIALIPVLTDITTDNYEISNNILSIKSDGEYKISGSCSECQISIKKGLSVSITLNSISIDNSNTGPFVIKKNAIVNLILEGESKIEDNEAEENEDLDDFEGAGIKFKSSSSLTISGSGKLKVIGNPKNGIKGAALTNLTINGGTLDISASKNALACDNIITINDGTIIISSKSDGIKAEPDSDDEESKGMIIINGGTITINSESDAIQAGYKLIINGGNFNIKTLNGASTTNFNKDNDSAKGLKCSTNEHENVENIIIIKGGNFILDTADDSIHSDYNLTIEGGTFEISSGDDGVHADQYLILGKLNSDNTLINLKVTKSYEGLEGAYVYIYSGTYNIISSDDGINSAGDADCGTNQGGPQNNNQQGPRNLRGRLLQENNSLCGTFHINIYGGEIYVNAGADGLDANGNVIISGGNIEIWGAKSGSDGDPIDRDGKLSISDATVLAGGNQGMSPIHQSSTINQQYIYTTQSLNANKQISILNGETTVKTITTPKNVAYIFYTSKDINSNYKFSTGTTSTGQTNTNNNPNQNPNNNNIPQNPNQDSTNGFPPNMNPNSTNNFPPNQNPNQNSTNGFPPNMNPNSTNNFPPSNSNNNFPNPNENQNSNSTNNFQPNPSNNNFQPNPSNNNFQPNPSNSNFQPNPSNNNFQPNPSNNNFQPNPSNGNFQPNPSNNNFQPNPSNSNFQPNPSNSNFQPDSNPNSSNNMPMNPNSNSTNNISPNPNSSSNNNLPPDQAQNTNITSPTNGNQNNENEDKFILFNFDIKLKINVFCLFAFILAF